MASQVNAVSLRNVRKLYMTKQYEEARNELESDLGSLRGSSRYDGLLLLGDLETSLPGAENLYREVVRSGKAKQALLARVKLARIRYASGDYRGAVDAVSVLPSKSYGGLRYEAIYFRALSWKQIGDAGRARSDFEQVDRGDFLYWAYMGLAELDMQEGRIEDAIERYETIAGGHSNPIAGFKLAECYEIQGERDKALRVYQTLLSQFPNSLEAPKAREKIAMITNSRSRRWSRRDRTQRKGGEEGERQEADRSTVPADGPLYTLQFGAFSERENALQLARELEDHTLDVRVERIESGGRIWHRVRAGRFSRREEAEKYAVQLLQKTGYSSKVLPVE
jgi:tetratricopeptide (TPR) repeat protein